MAIFSKDYNMPVVTQSSNLLFSSLLLSVYSISISAHSSIAQSTRGNNSSEPRESLSARTMISDREFAIVVFGASGFTGQFVVREVARNCKGKFKWAVAGRSKEKLEKVLQETKSELGMKLGCMCILRFKHLSVNF